MAEIESLADYEEYKEEKEKKRRNKEIRPKVSKPIAVLIVFVLSFIIGMTAYVISNNIIEKNQPKEVEFIGEQMSLTDENVEILYNYVTYNVPFYKLDRFVREQKVNVSSFTNEEKYYYALMFTDPSDLEFTGEYTDDKSKIYTLSFDAIKRYMSIYFGPNVSFDKNVNMQNVFRFQINKKNVAYIMYNESRDALDVYFIGYDDLTNQRKTKSHYGELISAIRNLDGSITLQERVVYTSLSTQNGFYRIDIYGDYERTILLDTKDNLTENEVYTLDVKPSSYQSATLVEYRFAYLNNTCYFESSRILK